MGTVTVMSAGSSGDGGTRRSGERTARALSIAVVLLAAAGAGIALPGPAPDGDPPGVRELAGLIGADLAAARDALAARGVVQVRGGEFRYATADGCQRRLALRLAIVGGRVVGWARHGEEPGRLCMASGPGAPPSVP